MQIETLTGQERSLNEACTQVLDEIRAERDRIYRSLAERWVAFGSPAYCAIPGATAEENARRSVLFFGRCDIGCQKLWARFTALEEQARGVRRVQEQA